MEEAEEIMMSRGEEGRDDYGVMGSGDVLGVEEWLVVEVSNEDAVGVFAEKGGGI